MSGTCLDLLRYEAYGLVCVWHSGKGILMTINDDLIREMVGC